MSVPDAPTPISGGPVEMARLARSDPDRFREEMARRSDRDQVLTVLAMKPADRLWALTHAPRPMRLVRSVPAPDLYLTVREVGPVEALPLIALASPEQILHVVDLESWRGDRFDGSRAGAWAAVLVEAGESTLRRFLRAADDAELALLFQDWARVEAMEVDDQMPVHGPGGTESGDERGTVSPDGWHRFRPEVPAHAPAVRRLAEALSHDDPKRYQRVLWAALSEMPSQLEEDALRWRSSRLEERGFPPWDEAIQVYAAPAGVPIPPPTIDADGEPAARFPLVAVGREGRLAAALDRASPATVESCLAQWLALASRVIVADGLDTGDPTSHVRAGVKVAGLVEIGLAGEPGADDARLAEVALIEWFRRGHARILRLRDRAATLVRTGWASTHPSAVSLLDSPILERVEALVGERPSYYELSVDGAHGAEREFRRPEEVDETAAAVELAEVVGDVVVAGLGLDVARVIEAFRRTEGIAEPKFSTLLLTALAWSAARTELRLEPLPEPVVADFLRDVASRRTASPDAPERALGGLLVRLVERVPLEPRRRGVLEAYGRACLERLADECAGLDPGVPADPRHVSCLWLGGAEESAR